MNTIIAKIYQCQQRLTGLFVSAGSMLAIVLELSLIVAGFVIKASQSTSNYTLMALFGIVGLLVALLITKLTLTNAAKLRASLDAENALQRTYKERAKGMTLPEDVEKELKKDIKEACHGRFAIYVLISIGVLASIICETFVMQLLFSTLQPVWLGDALSVFLSTLVSCTVVSGELHKGRDADIIRASLTHDSFLELAAKANVNDAFNKKVIAKASTHVEQVLDTTVLATYTQQLVYRSIEESTGTQNFALQVEDARQQQLQLARLREDQKHRLLAEIRGETEPTTEPVKPIKLYSENEIVPLVVSPICPIQSHDTEEPAEPIQDTTRGTMPSDFGDKIEALYRQNPDIGAAEIARQVRCTYHTARKWLDRLKAGNAG
jgi:hypothetical protein